MSAGCAMNASESDEPGSSNAEDLRKAPSAQIGANQVESLADEPDRAINGVAARPNIAPQLLKTEHVLGGGTPDQDGPRPHPWEPAPDTTNDNNSNSGTSGSSSTK
jgi:hypothetical protein